jgi:hypothetical protein
VKAMRASVLSESLSVVMLIGFACLPTLGAWAPRSQALTQSSAIEPIAPIHLPSLRGSTPARRQESSDLQPSNAEQPQKKRPGSPPARETGEASAVRIDKADSWSEAEVAAGLQDCAQQLQGITVEVEALPPIKDGQCGTPAPISLRRISVSQVVVQPPTVTTCRMARVLHQWVDMTVQPIAKEKFGSAVKKLIGASSYVCRNRNHEPAGPISEHAFANAIDIVGFELQNGRIITVLEGWGQTARELKAKGQPLQRLEPASALIVPAANQLPETDEAQFLRRMHKGACGIFGTVLGPEANEAHRNHFHLDLKTRKVRAFCE